MPTVGAPLTVGVAYCKRKADTAPMPTPNRTQRLAVTWARLHAALGQETAAAASLAALIRTASAARERSVLMTAARELRLTDHPAFRVNP